MVNRYYKLVGTRLKKFLYSKYPTINEAALYLETTGDSLRNSYFNGKAIPGGNMIVKLLKLGCDIAWLLSEDANDTELPSKIIYTDRQQKLILHELQNENYHLKEEVISLKKKVSYIEKLGLRITEYTEDKK